MKTASILLIASVLLFSIGTGVLAQETELPDPGLTPSSPLYFLEIIAEKIGTFFTFGDIKKAERHTILAAERLAETQAMGEEGKLKLVERTLERYENQLGEALFRAEKAETEGKDTKELAKTITEATYRYLIVLNRALERASEEAKPAIERAMTASVKEHEKVVEVLRAKNALDEVPEGASLPAEIPREVRERTQMRVQQELEIEKALEGLDPSKSLRTLCTEQGGPPETCEQLPSEVFTSFEQIEAFCVELGAPPEICVTLEAKCREYGITTPGKCFLLLMTANVQVAPVSE